MLLLETSGTGPVKDLHRTETERSRSLRPSSSSTDDRAPRAWSVLATTRQVESLDSSQVRMLLRIDFRCIRT